MNHSVRNTLPRNCSILADEQFSHRFFSALAFWMAALMMIGASSALRAQEVALPKAEKILDHYVQVTGGKAAYAKLLNRVEEINIEMAGSNSSITMSAFYARPKLAYFAINVKGYGKIEQGTDGDVAWESSPGVGPAIKEGAERNTILRFGSFDRSSLWRDIYSKTDCVGVATIDDKPCYKVVLIPKIGDTETHYYEQASGLLLKAEGNIPNVGLLEMYYEDYKKVDGVLFPHLLRRVGMGPEARFITVSKQHNVDIPADRFAFPDAIQATLAGDKADPRKLDLESFDQVWSLVNTQFWDPEFGGLDWQAVRNELRPRIMKASNSAESRAIMGDMISRLGLSHFAIIPAGKPAPASAEKEKPKAPARANSSGGETGIDARVIDGKALVTTVAEGSTAALAGVQLGWEILSINDYDVVASLKKLDGELPESPSKRVNLAAGMIIRVRSNVGKSVAITFRNGAGKLQDLNIPLGKPRGRLADVGNFGKALVRIDVKTIADRIGYISVSKFLDPEYVMKKFDAAMNEFMDADGIILDLRGNSGGKDAMAMAMLGWMSPKEWVAGRIRTRGNEIEMTVQPRAKTFPGPLVILTDGLTGSSAEFVAAALQENDRAFVIGTRTKGEALPASYTKLPNGDVFLYAVADFVTGKGNKLEGVGVTPDMEVGLTQSSLLEGGDLVLEAAIDWVDSQDQ